MLNWSEPETFVSWGSIQGGLMKNTGPPGHVSFISRRPPLIFHWARSSVWMVKYRILWLNTEGCLCRTSGERESHDTPSWLSSSLTYLKDFTWQLRSALPWESCATRCKMSILSMLECGCVQEVTCVRVADSKRWLAESQIYMLAKFCPDIMVHTGKYPTALQHKCLNNVWTYR